MQFPAGIYSPCEMNARSRPKACGAQGRKCYAVAARDSSTVVIPRQSIAQVPSPRSLEVFPAFDLPLGDSSQWFSYGGGVDLGLRYRMELPDFVHLNG
jgi:hypothetical protein